MCGLVAYFTNKQKNIKLAQAKFKWLLWYSQERGVEATGAGAIAKRSSTQEATNYSLFLAKTNKPATTFIRSKGFKELMKLNTLIAIGHTRQPTQGFPLNNKNNHPIYTKSGLAIVHNGIISNDKELVEKNKLQSDGLCDTEPYLKLIEKYYKKSNDMVKAIQEATKKVDGTIACLLLNKKEPRTLYAVSVNNPICFAYHISTGIIYIASTQEILEQSLLDYTLYFGFFEKRRNFDDYVFTTLEEGKGIKITPYGIKGFEVEVNSETTYRYPGTSYVSQEQDDDADDYLDKLSEKEKENFDVTEPIIRPSKYLNKLLALRLRHIVEQILYPNYIEEEEYIELKHERDRILDTLLARNYLTTAQAEVYKEEPPDEPEFMTKWKKETKQFKSLKSIIKNKKIKFNKNGQVELIESGN